MPIPGPAELVILLVIVLVIFGPGKLPSIGSAVGNGIREFRNAARERDGPDGLAIRAGRQEPPGTA